MVDEVLQKQVQAKVDMDRKIIDYLDTHRAERMALEHKVVALEFHNAVLTLIERGRKDGIINVSPMLSAEDIFFLITQGALPEQRNRK